MDTQAFEDIVRKYSPALHRYCSHRLSYDHQLAEEAVNDTMKILFLKWDTLEINDNIIRYLYRVADNCIKQARERNSKYYSKHISFEEAEKEGIYDEPLYLDDYFHDPVSEEKFLNDISQSLSEEYQTIFQYRYISGKSLMEIVKLTGIPYSTVRLRLTKILEYVKKQIKYNY